MVFVAPEEIAGVSRENICSVAGVRNIGSGGLRMARPPEPTGYGGSGPYDRSAYEVDKKQEAQNVGAPEVPRKSELLKGLR